MSKPSEEANLESQGYAGEALTLLNRVQAKIGSRLKIKTSDDLETSGLLIPRYEVGGDSRYIVLKLKSGYNIGIDPKTVSELVLLAPPEMVKQVATQETKTSESSKKVLVLSTGGTIASKVDYRTGAVTPLLSASELYGLIPELDKIASITPKVVFSLFSENLEQEHWQNLAEQIKSDSTDFDGVVVMVGTDTMSYVSAALSFALIGLSIPVVCVGSQRSSDRPSSDSILNLRGAVYFASEARTPGVFVAMHLNESDDAIAVHSGVRVRKNHTSKRAAFQSIDVPPFAIVRGNDIIKESSAPRPTIDMGNSLKTKFDSHVALLKFHPGIDPSIFDFLKSKHVRGVIIEGTGLGHVSSKVVSRVKDAIKDGVFVGITSQCIWGHVDLNVYSTGVDLIEAGATSLGNMLSETALAKLSWALGNFPKEDVQSLMARNLAGEVTERIPIKN
ncbi:MAG: Glu-tRNA(Gln) amidotransferase subunit GatD [Nitrososphaerales archaeon]